MSHGFAPETPSEPFGPPSGDGHEALTRGRGCSPVELESMRKLYLAGHIDAALAVADRVRQRMLIALDAVPIVIVAAEELVRLPLEPREAFLFTRVDGVSNVARLLEVAAMPHEEVFVLLERLIAVGALGLASPADEPTNRVSQPPPTSLDGPGHSRVDPQGRLSFRIGESVADKARPWRDMLDRAPVVWASSVRDLR